MINFIAIMIYWISRGVTEGLKWSDKPYKSSTYHLWRLVEVIAVFVAIISFESIMLMLGGMLVSIFLYERILMKIASDKFFKDKGIIFDIGIKIKRYPYQDWLVLGVGGLLLIL